LNRDDFAKCGSHINSFASFSKVASEEGLVLADQPFERPIFNVRVINRVSVFSVMIFSFIRPVQVCKFFCPISLPQVNAADFSTRLLTPHLHFAASNLFLKLFFCNQGIITVF
jgi:hypothetical protein